jgi:methionine sulfoxide reductase heme-binding subunit
MTPDMLPWVLARATGVSALVLLTGAMVAGLMVRTRTAVGAVKGSGMVDLHRLLSLLALLATAAHGVFLMEDATVEVSPLALVVPGLVPYRPLWTGIGVVVAELALLVHLSFRVRKRIGSRTWRRIHWLTYAVFAGAVVHGIGSGTDSGTPWALALYGGAVGAVAGLTGWRAVTARRGTRAAPRSSPSRQTRPMGDTVTSGEATP